MVQQDQISLMSEAYCDKLDKIEKLETELQTFRKFYDNRRKSLIFSRFVNIDIPPALPNNKIDCMMKHPNLSSTSNIVIVRINNDHYLICYLDVK